MTNSKQVSLTVLSAQLQRSRADWKKNFVVIVVGAK